MPQSLKLPFFSHHCVLSSCCDRSLKCPLEVFTQNVLFHLTPSTLPFLPLKFLSFLLIYLFHSLFSLSYGYCFMGLNLMAHKWNANYKTPFLWFKMLPFSHSNWKNWCSNFSNHPNNFLDYPKSSSRQHCTISDWTNITIAMSPGIAHLTPIWKTLFEMQVVVTIPSLVSFWARQEKNSSCRLKIQCFSFQDSVSLHLLENLNFQTIIAPIFTPNFTFLIYDVEARYVLHFVYLERPVNKLFKCTSAY